MESTTSHAGQDIGGIHWYHTIELPGGVTTPGRWDTRRAVRSVRFPRDLKGKRCLDVGTWDGFWAFEMERRHAEEVVAIDLDDSDRWDWPERAPESFRDQFRTAKSQDKAFWVAHRALESRVDRRAFSVYDSSPEALGTFDFVFVGSILLHLRDPAKALSALRSVVRGEILVADQVSLTLSLLQPGRPAAHLAATGEPHWWTPSIACLHRLVTAAGFDIVEKGGPYLLRPGPGAPRTGLLNRVGIPHAWCLARPAL